MEQYYYSTSTLQVYSAFQMQALFGINVETTDISILNLNGFYPVIETQPNFDIQLYSRTVSYTIVGTDALMVWTAAPLPLPTAIANGSQEEIAKANTQEANIVAESQLSTDLLTAVTGQELIDRPARFQDVLDAMGVVSDNLDANLTAIEAASTVDEINNIVNPPGGVLFTGRGAGLGPEDLNVSYYTAFNSVSMTESETELYVPSTATVIAYGSGGPGQFDSFGDCFNPGGPYVIQIREVATGRVIAEFEVPLAPAGVDVAF
jgi:hypothetical protein